LKTEVDGKSCNAARAWLLVMQQQEWLLFCHGNTWTLASSSSFSFGQAMPCFFVWFDIFVMLMLVLIIMIMFVLIIMIVLVLIVGLMFVLIFMLMLVFIIIIIIAFLAYPSYST
jgi:hypothetical protein